MRIRPALVALSLVLPALAVVTVVDGAPPARAVTAYTWQGTQSTLWSDMRNWEPQGIPEDGDSVTLPTGTITGVPTVTLGMLTVNGSPDAATSLSGEGTVSVGTLLWQGGDINVDLEVGALGALPSIIAPGNTPLRFGYGGQQTLRLLGQTSLATGLGAGTEPWLQLMFDSSIEVAGTGTLTLDPEAWVLGNRCCTAPSSTLRVDGTVEVGSITGATGRTVRLQEVGLDLGGRFDVGTGNTVDLVGGPVRAGSAPGSATQGPGSITGGGTFRVTETDGEAFEPGDPTAADGTLKLLDDLTLADGTTLELGQYAELAGAHQVLGDGSVRLAGARVRGEVRVAPTVPVTVLPGPPTRVQRWSADVGQRGLLTPAGGLTVAPGATLAVDSGARLVVPAQATLSLPAGATLTSGSCCTDPGRVTVQRDATLAIGRGSGDPTVLQSVEIGGAGDLTHAGRSQWSLAGTTFVTGATFTGSGSIDGDLPAGALRVTPVGVLAIDGDYTANAGGTYVVRVPTSTDATATDRVTVTGTASLSGAVVTTGGTRWPRDTGFAVLTAGQVVGGFGCARTPGFVPVIGSRSVNLRSVVVRDGGCFVPAASTRLSATFSGRRATSVAVPGQARRVLLRVTVSRTTRPTRLTLSAPGGATERVDAPARRTTVTYVVVRLGATSRLQATLDRRARLTVAQVGWYG
ncbi:hypothetical protein [Nocardioides rubriscoriae]|uniref:hypothetical protein n=1 Tax=Nocardioides rubriscoriae TaxID=642762 RepID=UPI0011DF8755|nr:hypothetical protein [Nocardioides rubriscoriae]